MAKPTIRDVAYIGFHKAKLQEPWQRVLQLFQEIPGILVVAMDSDDNPISVLDERIASHIASTDGELGDYLEQMTKAELVGIDVTIDTIISAMTVDPEIRWFAAQEEGALVGIAAPEAVLSTYVKWAESERRSVAMPVLASVFGIPFTESPNPNGPSYCCQGNPQHCYYHPVPRDKFKRPWCPKDQTFLMMQP